MARFRLKFLLQEFDLIGPEVVLGRGPECHITIEDPLVSRQHAAVRIRGEDAYLVDLGSRNGVQVNGEPVEGERLLVDGDRIRFGTQELLFFANRRARPQRPTGFMHVCTSCDVPFPQGSPSCPHCGAAVDEVAEAVSAHDGDARRGWTLELITDVVERALAEGRAPEASRLLRRAASEVDERRLRGDRLRASDVTTLSVFALRLARLERSPDWVAWALDLHRRERLLPAPALLDALEGVDPSEVAGVPEMVAAFLAWWASLGAARGTEDMTGVPRLERLARR